MTHRFRVAAELHRKQATVKGRRRFRIPISMNRNGWAQETADGCKALPRWGDDVEDFLLGYQKRSAPRTTYYRQAQTLSTQLLPHGNSSGNAVLLHVSTLDAV